MQEFRIDPEAESIFESPIFVSSSFEFKENWRGGVGYFEIKSSISVRIWLDVAIVSEIGLIDSCMIVNMRSYKVTFRLLIMCFCWSQVESFTISLAKYAGTIPRANITVYSHAMDAPVSSRDRFEGIANTSARLNLKVVAWWTRLIVTSAGRVVWPSAFKPAWIKMVKIDEFLWIKINMYSLITLFKRCV